MKPANPEPISGGCASPPRMRGLLRDFTAALGQQMFFWGRDVISPKGNLLCEFGFDRRPSAGLDGTSCYSLEYDGDVIELHGACVGRYSENGDGFLFVRNLRKFFLYPGEQPPHPGFYAEDHLRSGSPTEMYHASCRFLDWWLDYETWIAGTTPSGYRGTCFRHFRKLPKSKEWLPPEQGFQWLREFRDNPFTLRRSREWKRKESTPNRFTDARSKGLPRPGVSLPR